MTHVADNLKWAIVESTLGVTFDECVRVAYSLTVHIGMGERELQVEDILNTILHNAREENRDYLVCDNRKSRRRRLLLKTHKKWTASCR